MDIDALLEAFQDFEKKGKKETCPVLEQFLCHVAKTGQPVFQWSQFKTYFMFKLEKVMEDFHATTPEKRGLHNPNVEYVPFEEMKKRILKIVDGFSGIPFTIQRLCELLTDPKRNYTGIEKFLRGLEKNVMVVSCVYPTSEKNGACSVNRMNGVMFPGNCSLFSDSRNINGPVTPKLLNRPKLSSSASLSTNGLPDCPVGRESEPTTDDVEEQPISDSSPSVAEMTQNSGMKNKHPEGEYSDSDKQEVKRLKLDRKEEVETKCEEMSSLHKGSENVSEKTESKQDTCDQENNNESLCKTTAITKDHEPSSTQRETSETEKDSSEAGDLSSLKNASDVDQLEQPVEYENIKQDNVESSHTKSEESLPSRKQVPICSSSSPDLSTEGNAYSSNSTETSTEPEEQE